MSKHLSISRQFPQFLCTFKALWHVVTTVIIQKKFSLNKNDQHRWYTVWRHIHFDFLNRMIIKIAVFEKKTFFFSTFASLAAYLRVVHKSPSKPAAHPVMHVPSILEHWLTSRQYPHNSLHPVPYDPLSHSTIIKNNSCMLF